jgi:hypothetical protein
MVYCNPEIVKTQIICMGILKPIAWFDEAARRVGIMRVAFHDAGAREEHQRVLDDLHERTVEAVNILIDTYNGLVTGIDNLSQRDISRALDKAKKRLGGFSEIDRDIDTMCLVAGLYNFKRNPFLQVIGSDEIYNPKACLESFANN